MAPDGAGRGAPRRREIERRVRAYSRRSTSNALSFPASSSCSTKLEPHSIISRTDSTEATERKSDTHAYLCHTGVCGEQTRPPSLGERQNSVASPKWPCPVVQKVFYLARIRGSAECERWMHSGAPVGASNHSPPTSEPST